MTFSIAARGLRAVAALAVGATVAGALTAAAAAPATTAKHRNGAGPTLTVRVGGIRTAENGPPGPPAATGLEGVTFQVSPASAGHSDTCVSSAAGLCTFNVDANRTYTVTQTGTPDGWYDSAVLDAGNSPGSVPYPYDSLSVAVANANVTIPAASTNNVTAPTARGGTWALSRADPPLPDGCGLRIALLFDLSSSITADLLPTYKAAAISFVDALKGTPSSIAIYTFGTTAPSAGTGNGNLPPVSVETQAGVNQLDAKINGLTVPSGNGTNWDAGLWQVAAADATYHYQSTIVLTDGNPTYYGPVGNLGGLGSLVRFAETENAIFSANALKQLHSAVIGVGIGSATQTMPYAHNIRAISGPDEDTHYFNTDFSRLHDVLEELALRNCAGLDLTKTASPPTYTHVGQTITYHYTVTSTKYFTLDNVHVTDDHAGHVACVPSTLATDETAHCTAEYAITREDLDRGHLTNTATAHGSTPNDQGVRSEPAEATVRAHLEPAIHLVKSATPGTYAVAGEAITYTYLVTNTGEVPLHDVSLHDNRLGPVTCPHATLTPGESMTCTATHVTTQADLHRGRIVNTATVTGHPSDGSKVSDRDGAAVHLIRQPAVTLVKSASPAAYTRPGEAITYTYLVTNAGNVTLRHITVHDNRLGPVTCPRATLAPGHWMTCTATHVTTQADVDRGYLANSATVTGRPPAAPPVGDTGTAVVHAVHLPAVSLVKSAYPVVYTAPGQVITYYYRVANTGNVPLHDIALTDSRLGPVSCPRPTLAPGSSMTCTATHVTTPADVSAGSVDNAATVTGAPPAGPPVSDRDSVRVIAEHRPGISLVKSAYPVVYTGPDQVITYYYRVTNMGNAPLAGVSVADNRLGVITCPRATLAVGASMTCTATYRTTVPDVHAGHITNRATAAGYPPSGPPVSSADAATVTAHVVKPGLKIKKTASPAQFGGPGQQITYTYAVTNTGRVALTSIRVTDNRITVPVSCPATTLAPGKSMACHAAYVTTKADVSRGSVTNASLVTARTPSGSKVTAKATATVTLIEVPVTG